MSAERCSLISEMILFAMAQSGRAVPVHPLAKVRENLLSRSIAVLRLQFGPFPGRRVSNDRQYNVRKDRSLPVEFITCN